MVPFQPMTPEPPPQPSGTSESRWQALTRGVPLYVATFSRDGYLTFLNRGQGIDDPAPFLGRHISELLPLGDGLDVRDAITEVVGDGSPVRLEIPAMLQDNRMRWLELHLAPLREEERIVGVLAVGLDVTDSRQSAIELRMSVNALHRVIESREQLEADLHDGVLQSLFGVGLRLEAARAAARPPARPPDPAPSASADRDSRGARRIPLPRGAARRAQPAASGCRSWWSRAARLRRPRGRSAE